MGECEQRRKESSRCRTDLRCIARALMLYRKKPVIIEAEIFERDKEHRMSAEFGAAICWEAHSEQGIDVRDPHIHTLEGPHMIRDGDWIINGIKGEFYPVKDDIFRATYELVVVV